MCVSVCQEKRHALFLEHTHTQTPTHSLSFLLFPILSFFLSLSFSFLHLEASALSSASGLLELPALGSDVRLDVVVGVGGSEGGRVTEVLVHLSGLSGALEKDGVASGRSSESKLIESQALATVVLDSSSSSLGELERTDLQALGRLSHSLVIGDGANDDGDLLLVVLHVHVQLGDGQRRSVGSGHAKSLEDGVGELGAASSSDESVQLHEELQVHVVGLGGLPRLVASSSAASVQIDTHGTLEFLFETKREKPEKT